MQSTKSEPIKNILVTGGAGFIGSNLVLQLQKRNPQAFISVIDDFRSSSFKNLLGFRGEVIAWDVSDDHWLKIFESRDIDTIFHLASITDTTVLDEKKMIHDNVEGFRNVLRLALSKEATLVYASSAAVYGSQDTPMKEEDAGKPNNIYGFSKWAMDQLACVYAGTLKIVGLRYFNVFGPGESFKGKAASMIYQLAQQMIAGKRPRIFKWGDQKRDFIYVNDVVEATIRAEGARRSSIVNVGTGVPTSFNEVIEILNEALGVQLEPDYFDNPYDFYQDFTQADISLMKHELSWQPKFTTRAGIMDYVRNYLLPASQPQASAA